VADDVGKSPNPFDVQTIKNLVALMSRHDISEIYLRDGEARLRLRRGPHGVSIAPPASTPTFVSTPASNPTPVPLKTDAPASARRLIDIKSPTVGNFYVAANPGSEPFVRKGSRVTPETVVCIVEAMKVMNEIKAECSGVIEEIVVENGAGVEYGQVLFRVDPSA
jgi:acetyl-CoA carboxylase biotin carboxyl carrier protein